MTPTLIASRYRIIRELGRGGMGVVYLVEHVHTGEQHALKVLLTHAGASPEMLERFRREARAPARIKSEGVVKITDFDVAPELGGAPFLVMELLDGRDLDKQLEKHGRLSPEYVVWLFGEVANVLDRAHSAGVVHRDLKPENLFLHRRLDGVEVLKVVDFGISRISGEGLGDMTAAALTKNGAMMGTPLYMSPEQARGIVAKIGPATDMWSLGLIAHRLLTGDVYWTANTLAELMVQIISEPLSPPSERWTYLPPGFDAWFARSCDRDPSRRFSSVSDQARELARAFGLAEPAVLSSVPSVRSPGDVSGAMVAAPVPSTMAQSTASIARTVDPATKKSRAWVYVAAGTAVLAAAATVLVIQMGRSGGSATGGAPAEVDDEPAKAAAPSKTPVKPTAPPMDDMPHASVTASVAVSAPSASALPVVPSSVIVKPVQPPPTVTTKKQPTAAAPSTTSTKAKPFDPAAP